MLTYFPVVIEQGNLMSNFDTAMLTVLKNEGGFVDNPHDSGGPTNMGISLKFYRTVIDPTATAEDIKALTPQTVSIIYKTHWWDRFKYERILDQSIATKLLDMSINMGPVPAHIALQRAVLAANGFALIQDGVLGDQSITQINVANPASLLASFKSELAGHYRMIGSSFFINNWLSRAYQ